MKPDQYLDELHGALTPFRVDLVDEIVEALDVARHFGQLVLIAGNGGSAATADHLACDLARNAGKPIKAVSLSSNTATLTACANDDGYPDIYASAVETLGSLNDVLVVVSARGKSLNILNAIDAARRKHMKVLALLGFDGGPAALAADVALVVPSQTYGVVEDIHLVVGHMIAESLR